MNFSPLLFAQAPDAGTPAPAPAGDNTTGATGDPAAAGKPPEPPFFMSMPFMIGMLGLFFLVVILPQKRRQKKEQEAMMTAMQPGAKIVTNSGIVGTIVRMKDGDEEVVIRSDDTKLVVLRSTIARVVTDSTPATADAK